MRRLRRWLGLRPTPRRKASPYHPPTGPTSWTPWRLRRTASPPALSCSRSPASVPRHSIASGGASITIRVDVDNIASVRLLHVTLPPSFFFAFALYGLAHLHSLSPSLDPSGGKYLAHPSIADPCRPPCVRAFGPYNHRVSIVAAAGRWARLSVACAGGRKRPFTHARWVAHRMPLQAAMCSRPWPGQPSCHVGQCSPHPPQVPSSTESEADLHAQGAQRTKSPLFRPTPSGVPRPGLAQGQPAPGVSWALSLLTPQAGPRSRAVHGRPQRTSPCFAAVPRSVVTPTHMLITSASRSVCQTNSGECASFLRPATALTPSTTTHGQFRKEHGPVERAS